jgi:hypothetical protein
VQIRPARREDDGAIWSILEPVIRAGETYALPRGMSEQDALAYWWSPGNSVFVAEDESDAVVRAAAITSQIADT